LVAWLYNNTVSEGLITGIDTGYRYVNADESKCMPSTIWNFGNCILADCAMARCFMLQFGIMKINIVTMKKWCKVLSRLEPIGLKKILENVCPLGLF
jgi:hypothetical protein